MNVREQVERIYETERENIYLYLLNFGVPAGRAQELTQDTFLKLYLKMSQGDTIENPRAWLYRVAQNFAIRAHQRELEFDELDPNQSPAQPGPDPEKLLIARERRSILSRAIGDLSPQQRNCLHLRARGLRYREIAGTIGISTSAVGEFLRRAVTRLKEAMDG
jgi:RNA polymerase sigma-70 factor (ECF subfamily)